MLKLVQTIIGAMATPKAVARVCSTDNKLAIPE